ncbi:hypothetical protein SF12_17815, partial [Streptomyces sp. MBRL 601]
RRVTAWSRRTLWPLTLTWDTLRWYGAALLASGALAFEDVGLPRPLLTVAPAVLFAAAVLKTFPEHDQGPRRCPPPSPYLTRGPPRVTAEFRPSARSPWSGERGSAP